ncbi:MAG: magnesium-translocating P-type ATPase [Spirochaetales bacterium]|nr:magnesium-translocating P-type ATPase [Spirochaetales bacterium]
MDRRNLVKPSLATAHEKRLREACLLTEDDVLSRMETSREGLEQSSAEAREHIYGPNVLAAEKKKSIGEEVLERFANPLVIQLLVILIVSFFMSLDTTKLSGSGNLLLSLLAYLGSSNDLITPSTVGGMILISVFLAYFQEKRSTAAAEKLKMLVQATTIVLRDGKEVEIRMSEIVPGDIVVLAAGSIIPADLRVLAAKDFFVSQSALTGESMPVEKYPAPDPTKTEVFDLQNACFQGSTVISGSGKGVVVNTGMTTFLGGISANLAAPNAATDFDKGVSKFVWLMIRFMIVMVGVTFLIVGITKHNWLDALMFGLSIAVGLTPEMLPMIVTVCLSKGALFMSHKKVIVKKLKSIQNLGAIDILCTDKTGTITQDKVILEKHVDVTNRFSDDVLRYAYMNSYYQTGLRNLLDLSILSHEDLDVEKTCKKIDEIPFDFQRKRMSVVLDYEDNHVLICKGSVEAIFAACDKYQIDDDIFPMIEIIKNDIIEEYMRLSSEGYRVLAIAYREYSKEKTNFSVQDESGLVLLGYLAFLDPPKDSAEKAIASLREYGVRVKVLTGDNELVTAKVCRDVGFDVQRVITGKELSQMKPEDFAKTVLEYDVFAHLTPDQKEDIIKTLRSAGHVVGFMGDGINDAAAMKAADVGISVDTAVDVAKESADIILLEKNLLVLEDGIIEGRKTFNNIIKYIKMGASSNFGNMFSVVGASYLFPFLPMQPVQILLNNLLYDLSQTAIPLDNVDPEFANKPQSWDIQFIRRFMMFIGPISSIFDYATFALMWLFFKTSSLFNLAVPTDLIPYFQVHTVASDPNTTYAAHLFNTGWFVESLLTQTLIVHIIRTNKIPFLQSRASFSMTMTTVLVMAVGGILPYTPIALDLGLVPLPPIFWAFIAAFLVLYGVLTHNVKMWFHKRYGGIGA